MLSIQLVTPWNIFTPRPYRYLPQKYVEAFFADGSLRLSSFSKFSEHEDEQRQDANEGKLPFVHRTRDGGGQTVATLITGGLNAYVLCSSTYLSGEMMSGFGCDSYIRINDTTAFAGAVARHVPGLAGGAEGLCVYEENPGMDTDLGYIPGLNITVRDGQPTYDRKSLEHVQQAILHSAGLLPLFVKSARFASQSEYRWLWFVQGSVEPTLDIKVPEAREFCSAPPDLPLPDDSEKKAAERAAREAAREEFEKSLEPGTFERVVPYPPDPEAQ